MKGIIFIFFLSLFPLIFYAQGNRDKYVQIVKIMAKVSKETFAKKYNKPFDFKNDNILEIPINIGDLEMDSIINLGKIDTSELQFYIPLKNNSNSKELIIYNIQTSSGRVIPSWSRTPIKHNEIDYVNINLRVRGEGIKTQMIILSTNAGSNSIKLIYE